MLLHVSMVFILCALFCIILQISSRQLINYWLKTELNDIEKSYMTEEGSSHMWVAELSGNVRGMGIGSKLLTEVIAYAKRQKLDN